MKFIYYLIFILLITACKEPQKNSESEEKSVANDKFILESIALDEDFKVILLNTYSGEINIAGSNYVWYDASPKNLNLPKYKHRSYDMKVDKIGNSFRITLYNTSSGAVFVRSAKASWFAGN